MRIIRKSLKRIRAKEMAYVNGLCLQDLGSVDIKLRTDSRRISVVDSAALWKPMDNSYELPTVPTSLGKLCEFTTLSTTLLLLFFSRFFIKEMVVRKVRL